MLPNSRVRHEYEQERARLRPELVLTKPNGATEALLKCGESKVGKGTGFSRATKLPCFIRLYSRRRTQALGVAQLHMSCASLRI